MNRPVRHVLYEEAIPVELSATNLDLERLRAGFADLFERAAHALMSAGYDQDDGVIERHLLCRGDEGEVFQIEAKWLADRKRLLRAILAAARSKTGLRTEPPDILITGLMVRTILDPQRSLPRLRDYTRPDLVDR